MDNGKPDPTDDESNALALVPATKRKFKLDKDELNRIAREDKTKARRALEEEKVMRVRSHKLQLSVLTLLYRLRNRIFHRSGPHH